jgi:hypothetical protein
MRASLRPLFLYSMMAFRKSSIIGRYFISTMALVLSSIKRPHALGVMYHATGSPLGGIELFRRSRTRPKSPQMESPGAIERAPGVSS